MSIADALAALSAGRPPADHGLLGNARLEWAGGEAYGEEAILESFRAAPFDPASGTLHESATAAAWIGAGTALFADLYDGRIGRLWRIGPGSAPAREPAVAVAFDPDLRQARGDLHLRAEDHPELDSAAIAPLLAAARPLLDAADAGPVHRARGFVQRAFTSGEVSVALLAVHRLTGGTVRGSGFGHAIVAVGGGATPTVADATPPAEWAPRL